MLIALPVGVWLGRRPRAEAALSPLFDSLQTIPPLIYAIPFVMIFTVGPVPGVVAAVVYAIPHASAAYMAKQIVKQKNGRNIPVITTLHGTDITLVGKDKTYEPVVTFSINESDAITAVSQNLKDETYKSFAITKEIDVIYNFVDVARFNKKPIDAFRKVIAPKGEKILMHASNFRKVKRIHDVVSIFAEVRKAMPAKLLMVGDGPERPAAEEQARELGIEEDVRFLGKQEQMEDILAVSDVFLLPSEYESFGLAALEAMAARAVVISTNAGGLAEINIQGKTGFMANIGDVAAMSNFAIDLLKNDTELEKMKQAAYEQACEFDISKIIPVYEKLYSRFCRMQVS
jgi:N-acetyl-alpha-D-glucosaminyl L-malate synthase BshA